VSVDAPFDPTARDEDEAIRLQQLVEAVVLTSTATGTDGAGPADGRPACRSCRHYLNPDDPLAYCWHPDLRILVDAAWSCRHHDRTPEDR
jgi:hypothetical protein